jgi:voltage-gated potassium channel
MREPAVSVRQVVVAAAAFGGLLIAGTIGFILISGESLIDALFRTVSTVYTAGLVAPPETTGAKLFTLLLIVWGVAIFLYVFGLVIELVVRGTVSGNWAERRMRRRVERLEGHYIICGYGRVVVARAADADAAQKLRLARVGRRDELPAVEELFAPQRAVAG